MRTARLIDYLVINAALQSMFPELHLSITAYVHIYIPLYALRDTESAWSSWLICPFFPPLTTILLPTSTNIPPIWKLPLLSCHDTAIKQGYLKPDRTAKGIPQIIASVSFKFCAGVIFCRSQKNFVFGGMNLFWTFSNCTCSLENINIQIMSKSVYLSKLGCRHI